MELKDTVALMTSDNYKDRFKAEYYQLKIRYEKLAAMLPRYEAGIDVGVEDKYLGFSPDTALYTLKKQAKAMRKYLYYLEKRAALEDIEL